MTTHARCQHCGENTNHSGQPCPRAPRSDHCRHDQHEKCPGCSACGCHQELDRRKSIQDAAVAANILPMHGANLMCHLRQFFDTCEVPVSVPPDLAAAAALKVIDLGWRPPTQETP